MKKKILTLAFTTALQFMQLHQALATDGPMAIKSSEEVVNYLKVQSDSDLLALLPPNPPLHLQGYYGSTVLQKHFRALLVVDETAGIATKIACADAKEQFPDFPTRVPMVELVAQPAQCVKTETTYTDGVVFTTLENANAEAVKANALPNQLPVKGLFFKHSPEPCKKRVCPEDFGASQNL